MIIRHALLELSTYPKNKQSSIIINNEIIITSGIILESLQESQINLIIEKFTNSKKIIQVQEDKQFEFLKILKFQITFDQRSELVGNSPRILTRYHANLLYLYNCENIREFIRKILEKLNPTDNENLKSEILQSSFIILNLVQPQNVQNLYPNIYDFKQSVIAYSKFLKQINKLDDVMTVCTPFGLENFYKTINIGKVSNILGKKSCLFIISNTLSQGCEGSAVFNNKLRLIGILICTSLKSQNENFSISLVGNFQYIIKEFINQCGVQFGSVMNLTMARQPDKWEKSLVIIKSRNSQGTGTFVKILNRKFILTCAHVVSDNLITCHYIDGYFSPDIIWKNPNFNEPFDIALLSAPSNITDNYFLNLSDKKPCLGQSIYNAGFPFFTNFADIDKSTFAPSIFEGRIIKYSTGVLISDGILQAGQSGGPMFDENGYVLGICVSNLKLDQTIYPNINTSVPICDIKHILERFVKSNDNKILNNLIAPPAVKNKWALETPFIQSKL